MRLKRRIWTAILCTVMLFTACFSFSASESVLAATDLKTQQSQLEAKLSQLKKNQEAIASSLAEAKSKTKEQAKIVSLLYEEIDSYQSQLDVIAELIEEYRAIVQEKKARIEELNAQMDANFELFKRRLVFAQESGNMSYIDFVLGSSDLADILARSEQINDLLE